MPGRPLTRARHVVNAISAARAPAPFEPAQLAEQLGEVEQDHLAGVGHPDPWHCASGCTIVDVLRGADPGG